MNYRHSGLIAALPAMLAVCAFSSAQSTPRAAGRPVSINAIGASEEPVALNALK